MSLNLEQYAKISLDIGCGEDKQRNFVGMDKRGVPGVDIIHDLEEFPYPLDDNSCHSIMASHIVEHIKPWLTIELFDELWRIMQPDGQLFIATPYAGSLGYWQDPTHCNGFVVATFQYFDPKYPLYKIYKPKPWEVEKGFPVWQVTGNMECVMRAKKGKVPLGINAHEKVGIKEEL